MNPDFYKILNRKWSMGWKFFFSNLVSLLYTYLIDTKFEALFQSWLNPWDYKRGLIDYEPKIDLFHLQNGHIIAFKHNFSGFVAGTILIMQIIKFSIQRTIKLQFVMQFEDFMTIFVFFLIEFGLWSKSLV